VQDGLSCLLILSAFQNRHQPEGKLFQPSLQ